MASKGKAKAKSSFKLWSREVTEHSNALNLERGVFSLKDPQEDCRFA
jgi:hypothetical protein